MTTDAATREKQDTEPTSAPSAIPSPDDENPSSLNADAGEIDQGDGQEPTAQDGENEPAAPASKPLEQMTLAELKAKALESGLSAAEIQRQNELQRAEDNRNRDIARIEEERQAQIAKVGETWTSFSDKAREKANERLAEMEIVLPPAALRAVRDAIDEAAKDLYTGAVAEPLVENMRIDTMQVLTDAGMEITPVVRANIGKMKPAEIFELHRELGRTIGYHEGLSQTADKDNVLVPKKEWDEYQLSLKNEEAAANGDKAAPRRPQRAAAANRVTREQYMAMNLQEQARFARENPEAFEAL